MKETINDKDFFFFNFFGNSANNDENVVYIDQHSLRNPSKITKTLMLMIKWFCGVV